METLGIWPKSNEDESKRSFNSDLRVGISFVAVTFLTGIPVIWALIRVWGDLVLMADNLQIALPFATVTWKLIILRWKRPAALSVVNMMEEDWLESKIDAERTVMIKHARIARLIIIIASIFMTALIIITTVPPYFGLIYRSITNLTDGVRPLLFQSYYFYDTDKSPQFELTCFVQTSVAIGASIIYILVDCFFGLIVLHAHGQFENFRGRLITLASTKDFNSALSDNVMSHLRIIRFVGYIEEIFTFLVFGLILLFIIIFCMYGFMFLMMFTSDNISISVSRVFFLCIALVGNFFFTFCYCACGEIMIQQILKTSAGYISLLLAIKS